MRMFRPALFLMMISLLGCAGSQPVRLQLPPEARIGILNLLEPEMTHVDMGSLRFDSFSKAYKVDWDISGYVNRSIQSELKGRGNYTFIPLADNARQDWKQSTSNSILDAVTGLMRDDLKAFMNQTAEENRLDLIISVSSYDTGRWPQAACFEIGKNPVVTNGYGIYTRTKALSGLAKLFSGFQNTATPYANIVVAIFQARPVKLASYAHAPCSRSSLPDFPWKSDLRHLSSEVLRQVRPHVERLSTEAARTALANAGLLP
jgi:hypothetical protein